MDKETRIQKIASIAEGSPHGMIDIPWRDALKPFNVYMVPLEYLVYNKYNGRILSRTKSLEKQNQKIDVESVEGKKKIEKLLWDSAVRNNMITEKSINKIGQEKVGIITKDGIIVDGNRRAMILNRMPHKRYFKTIILDVTGEEDPTEIEKLETTYQLGEDEKVGYNAIEKYLKIDGLHKKGVSLEEIAEWMSEDISDVKKWLETMKTMDEYLEYRGYDGIYTQLDEREDAFLYLTQWLNYLYGKDSKRGFDGYQNHDVDDLKFIAFDYIRIKLQGAQKEFRQLIDFFGDKNIWQEFKKKHQSIVQPIINEEGLIDYNSSNLTAHLDDRDSQFTTKVEEQIQENHRYTSGILDNRKAKDQPIKLTNKAFDALNSIDSQSKTFMNKDVLNQIEQINNLTSNLLIDTSAIKILSKIINLLKSINIKKSLESKEEMIEKVKEINQLSFEMKKELGL